MAERPVFIPSPDSPGFVREKSFTITWAGGFAAVQKKKNVRALHDAAETIGLWPVLEASTKSDEKLGQHLSAFHLKVKTAEGDLPLECVYQGSKVFERGGPYTDLRFTDPRSAKRDPRLHESGRLVAFMFDGHEFPLEPKTVFYDWLYITAIFPHRDWLDRLSRYAAFSDIEFNPQKSVNCQARSLALFVSLKAARLLDDAVCSSASFIEIMHRARQQLIGVVAEAPAAAVNSPVETELMAGIAAEVEFSRDVSAEPPRTADLAPAVLQGHALEEATPPAPNVIAGTAISDRVTPVLVPETRDPPPDFETFLREKALRKPKSSGKTRRRSGAARPEKGQQLPALARAPMASE